MHLQVIAPMLIYLILRYLFFKNSTFWYILIQVCTKAQNLFFSEQKKYVGEMFYNLKLN